MHGQDKAFFGHGLPNQRSGPLRGSLIVIEGTDEADLHWKAQADARRIEIDLDGSDPLRVGVVLDVRKGRTDDEESITPCECFV